jgi:hypothetical protein
MEVLEENIDINGSLRRNFFLTFNFDTFLFGGNRNRCIEQFGEPPSWQLFIDEQVKTDLILVELVTRLECLYYIWSYEVYNVNFFKYIFFFFFF